MTKYFIFWPVLALVSVGVFYALLFVNSAMSHDQCRALGILWGAISLTAGCLVGIFLKIVRHPGWPASILVSAALWSLSGALLPHVFNHFERISGDGGVSLVSVVYGLMTLVFGAVFGVFVKIFNEPTR